MNLSVINNVSVLEWHYRDNVNFGDDVARYIQKYLEKEGVLVNDVRESISRFSFSRTSTPVFYYKGASIEASHYGEKHQASLRILADSEEKCKSLLEELLVAAETKAFEQTKIKHQISRAGVTKFQKIVDFDFTRMFE